MAMEHDQEEEKQRQPWAMAAVLLMMEAGRSRYCAWPESNTTTARIQRVLSRGGAAGREEEEVRGRASGEWWRNGRSDLRQRDASGGWAVIDEGEIDEDVQPLWLCAWLLAEALRVAADGVEMVTDRTGSEEDGGWLGGYWWFGRLCAWLPAKVRW
ncbi:sulfite oxidase [Sesbania bispinosa]|nr:sulfite oxidase [Sesbania bispinosa]